MRQDIPRFFQVCSSKPYPNKPSVLGCTVLLRIRNATIKDAAEVWVERDIAMIRRVEGRDWIIVGVVV